MRIATNCGVNSVPPPSGCELGPTECVAEQSEQVVVTGADHKMAIRRLEHVKGWTCLEKVESSFEKASASWASNNEEFTKEFEEEAIRLVEMSGRAQREITVDLGIGLSTLP